MFKEKFRFESAAVALVILSVLSSSVYAQVNREVSRGFKRQDAYDSGFDFPEAVEEAPAVQVLPPAVLDEDDELADKFSIEVREIRLKGNTVLTASQINVLVGPYSKRFVTADELQRLRLDISKKYLKEGYINSGAILRQQDFSDGIVEFTIIEGGLTDIELIGETKLRESYITGRVDRQVNDPLNLNEVQAALQMLKQNPLIGSVQAQLKPGTELGESILQLQVQEQTPYSIHLTANNYRSPSVGAEQGVVTFIHRNLTGNGDALTLSGSASEGVDLDSYISYLVPLNSYDTRVLLSYNKSESEVIEEPFDQLEVESEADSATFTLFHPFINTLNRRFEVFIGAEKKHSESYLLGQKFSFSAGSVEGESDTAVAILGAEWIERTPSQVIAFRATIQEGMDQWDATISEDNIPDGEYTAYLGQFQFIQRVDGWLKGEVRFRSSFQLTDDALLSLEKFAVGGRYTVRGYRENTLVRDNGVVASLEYHLPLFTDEQGISRYGLKLVPFYDWGRSWDEDYDVPGGAVLPTTKKVTIESIGVGLEWQPAKWFHSELYWGDAQDDVVTANDDDLQDDGFHVSVTVSWPFD